MDDIFLFDLGEEAFLTYQPKYILITHLHPDHAFFVREPKKDYTIDAPLFAPESFKGNLWVKALTQPKSFGSYEITPIPTHHSHKVNSQAYLIKKGKEKMLYTGDMIWINKEYHHLLENLDLVITEGSFIQKGGRIRRHEESKKIYGHTGIPNLLNFFKPYTRHLIFVHFGSWFYQNMPSARKKLITLGKEHGINVYVGHDGMTLDTKNLE